MLYIRAFLVQCHEVNKFESKFKFNVVSYIAGNYMLKVNNRNTRTMCEICSKLTIKTPERRASFWYLYC